MKAVNLIPREERHGAGRSGLGVYVVLGALGLLVVAVVALVLAGNSVTNKESELAQLQQDTAAAEAEAAELSAFSQFAVLSQTRMATVQSLALSRFDWERAIRQVASVMPTNVWLTSLVGTIKPGVAIEGGSAGGGTSQLRNGIEAPAIEIVGCTESHSDVARMISRLRAIHGVDRVMLTSSEKLTTSTTATGQTAAPTQGVGVSGDCRFGDSQLPRFELIMFFTPLPGQSAVPAPGATAGGTQQAAATTGATP